MRLENAFIFAKSNNFTQVSSTMMASPYMNYQLINQIGQTLATKYELDWLIVPDKQISLKNKGFYIQNFCGCLFSLQEKTFDKHYSSKTPY